MPRIRAIILDFDGLILDTETSCFTSWRELFAAHGQTYELADFQKVVGTHNSVHDPKLVLEKLCGTSIDWSLFDKRQRQREQELNAALEPLPGVIALLDQAKALALKLGVASSSRHWWVDGHLERRDLFARFETIVCRDDGLRPKPEPDIYLEAISRLGVAPDEALAIEDSHNGSLAAKSAGLRCLAVPNNLTRTQDFSHVDRRVETLAGLDLAALINAL